MEEQNTRLFLASFIMSFAVFTFGFIIGKAKGYHQSTKDLLEIAELEYNEGSSLGFFIHRLRNIINNKS